MKDIIRRIREASALSQDRFAMELGTTAVSINRWENGKTVPSQMAQKQLYSFCRNHQIEASDIIVHDYEYVEEGKLVLYHASRKGIMGDIAPVSRAECDFGKGFYMGTNTLQPLTLVCIEKNPGLYVLELDRTELRILNLDIGMDWAMLIAYNRGHMDHAVGTAIYEKYSHFTDSYDVITGPIADDRMYTALSGFFNGTITDVALLKCLSALDLGRQYVAVTGKACKRIKIISERKISAFELSVLQDRSAERRNEGISLAEKIMKQHRREGRYFDEILGGL